MPGSDPRTIKGYAVSMKLWISSLAAGFSLALPTSPLIAASKNGDDLLLQCQTSSSLAVIACHIYIHAVSDVLEKDPVAGRRACIPANADIDRSVKVIVDWLVQHADQRQQPASDAVARALSAAYPCN